MEQSTVGLTSEHRVERNRAWRQLYDLNFNRIYGLVRHYGVPMGEAEDVVQKVFVVAHRRLGEDVNVENVAAWLRGIAVRVVSEHRRRRNVRQAKHWILRTQAQLQQRPRKPDQSLEAQEAQIIVAAVLDKMSPKLRDVMVLVELEQLTSQEVAEVLGIPLNTVRSRRRLARASFEKILKKLEVRTRAELNEEKAS